MAGYAYGGSRPRAGGAPECGTMAAVAVHLRAGVKPRDLDYKCRVALSEYKSAHNRANLPARGDLTPEQLEAAREAERKRYTPRAELPPEEVERLREAGRQRAKREGRRGGLSEEEQERRRARDREAYARRQAAAGRTVEPRPSARKSTPAAQRAAQQLENKRARDRAHYKRKAEREGREVTPRGQPPQDLAAVPELPHVDAALARRRRPGPKRNTAA